MTKEEKSIYNREYDLKHRGTPEYKARKKKNGAIYRAKHKDEIAERNKPKSKARSRKYYETHKDECQARHKKYEEEHPEEMKQARKQYREEHKDELKAYHHQYYLDHKDELQEKQKKYKAKNIKKIKDFAKNYREDNKEQHTQYCRDRWATDPLYRLTVGLRNRITFTFSRIKTNKPANTIELLGTDYNTVKKHIEQQFREGMTWGNYGEWHIDHIIPLASTKDMDELIALCHYTNLQPLWAEENFEKHAKLDWNRTERNL